MPQSAVKPDQITIATEMIETRFKRSASRAIGHAQQGVEQGEIEPAQQAQLGVGDLQVDLDRLADGGDDRAVDEVEV